MRDAPIVRTRTNPCPDDAYATWLDSFDGARLRLIHFGGTGDRGTALVVPGWTEPSEKYAEVALDLIDRGFKVVAYDLRGQGLSQRKNAEDGRGRIDDLAKHIQDLNAVVDHLSAERLTLLAHSLGGLVTLSWLAEGGQAEVAVLSAPATQLYALAPVRAVVGSLTWGLIKAGYQDLPLAKKGGMAMQFEGNTVTSDPERHALLRDLLLADQGLDLPQPYPAMVAAMQRQQAALHQKGAFDKLTVPTLIVSADQEKIVDAKDHARIAKRSPLLSIVTIEGALHEVLMERDEFRDQFWDAFDAHIDRYVSPAPALSI